MLSPFHFGKIVESEYFTNRNKERKLIVANILAGINCILLSPRRWGKSSLVEACISQIKREEKKIIICKIDLFKIQNEVEFYELYMKEVLKNSSSKWEDWIELSKQFLKSIVPNISLGLGGSDDVSLSFKIAELPKSREEILMLPEKIAEKKKLRFIICIDEFQNIKKFQRPSEFQEYLRAVFQYFKFTSFIIYGSKRHIMTDLFNRSDMPFFKFGEMLFLTKIATTHWEKYIIQRFESTGKEISIEKARQLAEMMKNHPYFVQQLCHHTWLNCTKKVDDKTIELGLTEMLEVNEILYIREIENLTPSQIYFLKALINEEEKLTSQDVLSRYQLGSSGNVKRLKEALENKEILDFIGPKPEFNDPSFETWLSRYYFTE